MKFVQIRNATIHIEYAGKKFLIDPMLAPKGSYPAFPGTPNSHKMNPLVDLPIAMDDIVNVDAVIVTHTHLDHWDEAAKQLIPQHMLIFVQNEQDATQLQSDGFHNIRIIEKETYYEDIKLTITKGQHGSDDAMAKLGERLGEVSGIIFEHPNEKTVYLAGDTVWNQYVIDNLQQYTPDIIILNSGDAQLTGLGSIIMGKEDVYQVYLAAPQAIIIASHMESVNHALLSRKELREFIAIKEITERVLVPEDGEVYQF